MGFLIDRMDTAGKDTPPRGTLATGATRVAHPERLLYVGRDRRYMRQTGCILPGNADMPLVEHPTRTLPE